jgi:transposase-like protein
MARTVAGLGGPGSTTRQVARELGINPDTLADWMVRQRHRHAQADGISQDEQAELVRLRACAMLRMERYDVLCLSSSWVGRWCSL